MRTKNLIHQRKFKMEKMTTPMEILIMAMVAMMAWLSQRRKTQRISRIQRIKLNQIAVRD